ncbi:hypothetical protein V6U78_04260 [Marinospirillum sp. MEB164]|uniref:Uncharacterized protein n=1 Tax=Marinospirillum alkalitolerans TaxID=3123374 RepID=A0ABW8PVD3_9GAMM
MDEKEAACRHTLAYAWKRLQEEPHLIFFEDYLEVNERIERIFSRPLEAEDQDEASFLIALREFVSAKTEYLFSQAKLRAIETTREEVIFDLASKDRRYFDVARASATLLLEKTGKLPEGELGRLFIAQNRGDIQPPPHKKTVNENRKFRIVFLLVLARLHGFPFKSDTRKISDKPSAIKMVGDIVSIAPSTLAGSDGFRALTSQILKRLREKKGGLLPALISPL